MARDQFICLTFGKWVGAIEMAKRNYSLTGPNSKNAVETGLATAEWYHTDIPRKDMKALMQRSDDQAIRDTILLVVCMFGSLWMAIALWPSWWSAPFWLIYGVFYGSAMDSRWHECGHGTAFKTRWMNDWIYEFASFCMIRNSTEWRWSHARHHTDTIIVGRDPEIAIMRPPQAIKLFLAYVGILDAITGWKKMVLNAAGYIEADVIDFVPEQERPRVIKVARVWFTIYAITAGIAVYTGSILPFMVIGLPRIYGAWHHVLTGFLQHGGLADNVIDHRLNSRTVYMNPISRFIYWNMNYHVEHHMFPMVPYHRLPELHEKIKHDLPAPQTSMWQAYKEVIPAVFRQMKNEDYFIKRELPPTAQPYREDLHQAALGTTHP
jgi:fatty acid desaturase